MAMRPCQKCLENNWSFEKLPDNYHRATCNNCGNIVEWKKPTIDEKPFCRECNRELTIKESKFKPSKLNKPYYFTHVYYCERCHKLYLSEKFKIINSDFKLTLQNTDKLL